MNNVFSSLEAAHEYIKKHLDPELYEIVVSYNHNLHKHAYSVLRKRKTKN